MSSIKRMLALSGLMGVLGALAFALPAQASDIDGACVATGSAKANVLLLGGSGTFTFNSFNLVCAGLEKGAPAVTTTNARASGHFTNIVCGTGKAVGTIQGLTGKYAVFNKKFAVEFVAFNGVFYWHNPPGIIPAPGLKPLPNTKDPTPKAWKPAGTVTLLPPGLFAGDTKPPVAPSPPNCTKAFSVVGTVLVTSPKVPPPL